MGIGVSRTLASFWTGRALGPIEQVSALSCLSSGHHLIVYSTDDLRGVPPGVEVRDANAILSTETIVRHRKSGSSALYSDLFRYSLMNKTDYVWVDLDLVVLNRLNSIDGYIFGYEDEHGLNGAVLRLPKQSEALALLSKYNVDTFGIPDFITGVRRFRYLLKSLGRGAHISEWPWGAIGPRALTHFLRKTGEMKYAFPVEAFYPVAFRQSQRFLKPVDLTLDSFSEKTIAVHLWGNALRRLLLQNHNGNIPARSFLGLMIEKYSAYANFDIGLRMLSS